MSIEDTVAVTVTVYDATLKSDELLQRAWQSQDRPGHVHKLGQTNHAG